MMVYFPVAKVLHIGLSSSHMPWIVNSRNIIQKSHDFQVLEWGGRDVPTSGDLSCSSPMILNPKKHAACCLYWQVINWEGLGCIFPHVYTMPRQWRVKLLDCSLFKPLVPESQQPYKSHCAVGIFNPPPLSCPVCRLRAQTVAWSALCPYGGPMIWSWSWSGLVLICFSLSRGKAFPRIRKCKQLWPWSILWVKHCVSPFGTSWLPSL